MFAPSSRHCTEANRWRYFVAVLVFFGSFKETESALTAVSSTEDTNKNAIEGFGTSIQCSVNTCLSSNQKIKWYKNDMKLSDQQLLADGTKTFNDRMSIKHSVALDNNCNGRCTSRQQCPSGLTCRPEDDMCCPCSKEEFTLVIKNLTLGDMGKYKCQLDDGNSVEIRLTVMEGGSFPSFGQNLTFNHTTCCESRGMSEQCTPMCRPGLLETHKFDPIPCQKEFPKLLHCATEGGNISHTHCCRLHFVPQFCWEYCAGPQTDFSHSNRLCVYWMPEIFQCYEQSYLPLPGPPEGLVVNAINSSALDVCWDEPERRGETVTYYTVRYQEVPRFPLLSGAIPFLTPDTDSPGSDGDIDSESVDEEQPHSFDPGMIKSRDRSRDRAPPVPSQPQRFGRKKRQTLIITTHNFATNTTDTREYRYLEVNTTDTCVTIKNLKPSTQYFVYVTAANSFGSGLPSLRQTAVTEAIVLSSNASLPDVKACCIQKGVDEACVPKMCDLSKPPGSTNAFDLAFTCRNEFDRVSPCLADGRDHTECCREKGVVGECLNFCRGNVTKNMSSVLCLSLDIQPIYACFREGYETLPSPPVNLTVSGIGEESAVISWNEPLSNREKVDNYSLFYRHPAMANYFEVEDVTSPYWLFSLKADTTYSVYLIARGFAGNSLKSTVATFYTSEKMFTDVCEHGKPLLDAYGKPLKCGLRLRCPETHTCVESQTDDPDLKYCCPKDGGAIVGPTIRIMPNNVTDCCRQRGVKDECVSLCSYKVTTADLLKAGLKCVQHVHAFIECGNDGRNDVPCCKSAGVADGVCLDFCSPPLTHSKLEDYLPCLPHTERILQCALEGVLNLPGRPINVSAEDVGTTWVTLHWKRPVQAPPVDRYEIFVNNVTNGNTTGLSITISNLKANGLMVAHVVAWNSRGSSLPSETANFNLNTAATIPPGGTSSDDKPRTANTIRKVSFTEGKANITWNWRNDTVSGKPITRYQFKILYRDETASPDATWKNVSSTELFVVLPDLVPGKIYDVKVIATNLAAGVDGLPSETAKISATASIEQIITLSLRIDPPGDLKIGDRVVVICSVTSASTPMIPISMTKGSKLLAKTVGEGVSYTFDKIKQEDASEPVECVATGSGGSVNKSEHLKVQFPPAVKPYLTNMNVYQDLTASLVCRVEGNPKPVVTWLFSPNGQNPKKVADSDDYITSAENADQEYATNFSLKVVRAKDLDNGYYTCKACTNLGCSDGSIKLTVETVPIPTSPDQIYDCCVKQRVKPNCMSACTGSLDINTYVSNTDCLNEVTKLLACAKDGVDKRSCCRGRNVAKDCLFYCDGTSNPEKEDFSKTVDCSDFGNSMLNCLIEGHRSLPPPPENLKVTMLDDGRANVTWKTPSNYNGDPINMYVLSYKSSKDKKYTDVRTDRNWVVIKGLQADSPYNFTALSKNRYGWSSYSPQQQSLVSSRSTTRSSGSSGVVLAVLFCLLLIVAVTLAFVYYRRRPHRLPAFLLKFNQRGQPAAANGAVAFENPGYDKEGQVRGLPGDHESNGFTSSAAAGASSTTNGWEHPNLETPDDSPLAEQRGMRYAPLS